ncbi:hypothetical protein ABPG75_002859 [Micractinium tetrahymenae]
MQAQAWSIPFPRKDRGGKKKKRVPGSRKPAAAPPAPRRPLPQWNSSTTDLDKHKLTPAELAFRRSLRQSRHRQQGWAAQEREQMEAATVAAAEDLDVNEEEARAWADDCGGWPAHSGYASGAGELAEAAGNNAASDADSDAADSLVGMQAFVAELQRKYSLAGVPPLPQPAPTAAQRKLAALQAAAAAKATAADDGEEVSSDSGSESDGCRRSLARLQGALSQRSLLAAGSAAAAPQQPVAEGASDSEGEGHLGPAAVRRARQRQAAAAVLGAASSTGPCGLHHQTGGARQHPPAAHDQHQQQQQEDLEARLAAAEGQLAWLAGVEAELRETQAEVAQLREQNAQLQTDLHDFVSHTSILLTSLQTQLSGFLAAAASPSGGGAPAALQQQASPTRPTAAAAAGAALVQARAAAEALSIAQQAQARAAGAGEREAVVTVTAVPAPLPPAAAAGSALRAAEGDVLAALQLPTFRGFAQLQRPAAMTACVPGPSLKPLVIPPLPSYAAGGAAGSWERCSEENSPPRQRDAARLPTPMPTGGGSSPLQ